MLLKVMKYDFCTNYSIYFYKKIFMSQYHSLHSIIIYLLPQAYNLNLIDSHNAIELL